MVRITVELGGSRWMKSPTHQRKVEWGARRTRRGANLLTGHVRPRSQEEPHPKRGFQAAPAALWFQAVAIAQFSRRLQVFSRSHQLSNLPDMSQIVHGPLMQHLLQGDFAGLLVPGAAFTGASRQGPQILHIDLALLFKMVEGVFRIGI